MQIKNAIKQLCPPILWGLLKQVNLHSQTYKYRTADERAKPLEAYFRQLNSCNARNAITIRPEIKLSIHPESVFAFEHFCFRSPSMVDELDMFLNQTASMTNLLDIGAYHGIFSLAFAAKASSRRILAIEASPIAFARLLYNIHKNQFTNVDAIECAMTEASGSLKMHYECEHAVATSVTDDGDFLEVQADTGDNICKKKTFSPDIIKIDVEGHEIKVLKGLTQTLNDCRPVIFLEIHPGRIAKEGDSIADIESIFSGLNYSAKSIGGEMIPWESFRQLGPDDMRIVFSPNAQSPPPS